MWYFVVYLHQTQYPKGQVWVMFLCLYKSFFLFLIPQTLFLEVHPANICLIFNVNLPTPPCSASGGLCRRTYSLSKSGLWVGGLRGKIYKWLWLLPVQSCHYWFIYMKKKNLPHKCHFQLHNSSEHLLLQEQMSSVWLKISQFQVNYFLITSSFQLPPSAKSK